MNKKAILKKIQQIESLLKEVKRELNAREAKGQLKKMVETPKEKLIEEYDKLYSEYLLRGSDAVIDFVKNHKKDYLKIFCKANNLSVTSKTPKRQIVEEIIRWFKQRKVITQKIT